MAKSVKYTVNFLEAKEGDLHRYGSSPGHLWPLLHTPQAAITPIPVLLSCTIISWALMASCCPLATPPTLLTVRLGFYSSPCPLPCRIEIPFKFHMLHSGLVHGLAFWFDVAFIGSM